MLSIFVTLSVITSVMTYSLCYVSGKSDEKMGVK
jgi:hypothetical protein